MEDREYQNCNMPNYVPKFLDADTNFENEF